MKYFKIIGNLISIVKESPEFATKFFIYDHTKQAIRGEEHIRLTTFQRFIAAALAGLGSQTIVYPLEVCQFI